MTQESQPTGGFHSPSVDQRSHQTLRCPKRHTHTNTHRCTLDKTQDFSALTFPGYTALLKSLLPCKVIKVDFTNATVSYCLFSFCLWHVMIFGSIRFCWCHLLLTPYWTMLAEMEIMDLLCKKKRGKKCLCSHKRRSNMYQSALVFKKSDLVVALEDSLREDRQLQQTVSCCCHQSSGDFTCSVTTGCRLWPSSGGLEEKEEHNWRRHVQTSDLSHFLHLFFSSFVRLPCTDCALATWWNCLTGEPYRRRSWLLRRCNATSSFSSRRWVSSWFSYTSCDDSLKAFAGCLFRSGNAP